jgi:hypothetical protein
LEGLLHFEEFFYFGVHGALVTFHQMEKVVIRIDFVVIMVNSVVIIALFVVIISDSVVIMRQNVVITYKSIDEHKKNCPGNQFNTDFLDNCIIFLFKSNLFNCFFIKTLDDFNNQLNSIFVVVAVKHRCV